MCVLRWERHARPPLGTGVFECSPLVGPRGGPSMLSIPVSHKRKEPRSAVVPLVQAAGSMRVYHQVLPSTILQNCGTRRGKPQVLWLWS